VSDRPKVGDKNRLHHSAYCVIDFTTIHSDRRGAVQVCDLCSAQIPYGYELQHTTWHYFNKTYTRPPWEGQ
jgi:hypothetical protein